MNNNTKGIIYCLLTAIFWGSGFPAQYIGGASIGSFYFNALRTIIGVFVIFLAIILNNLYKYKRLHFFNGNEDKIYIIRTSLLSGFVLATAILIQQIGVEQTISAKSGLISSLTCVVVPLILMIIANRKVHYKTWILIFILIIGMGLLNSVESASLNIGDLICFISTIFFSIDIIIINNLVKDIDPLKFSLFRFITVSIVSFILAKIFDENLTYTSLRNSITVVVYSGIFVTGLAYTTQLIGEKYTEPIVATILMGLEGLFACIFGFLILGEVLTNTQILGCAIIIICTILIQLNENKYQSSNINIIN